ncbi:DDB1- and CUL4-associated factor 6 [Mortierella sp. GBA30]|nr:DDB1- and CUL4-associated factor 6 [Mortierella sp. GBA30]
MTNGESPARKHRRASSSSHNHSTLLRGLSGLQTVPVSRQGSLKHHLLGSESFVKRMEQQPLLKGHTGCVNTIAWDETGEYLLSGSDDRRLNIYRPLDPSSKLVHSIPSGHTHNIFSAKFLTNSSASTIISCSADGITRLTSVPRFVERSRTGDWVPSPGFNCHTAMTYEVLPDLIDGHIFYDCSDDGRINRYDTRISSNCTCDEDSCERHTFININSHLHTPSVTGMSTEDRLFQSFRRRRDEVGISAITQRPENPNYFATACADDTVRIFDSRMASARDHRAGQVYSFSPYVPTGWKIGADGELERGLNKERGSLETRITSLKYDPCRSGQLLASYSRGNCYLIDPSELSTGLSEQPMNFSTNTDRRSSDSKGKRRRSPSAGSDHSSKASSTAKRSPGSWSPTLPRKSSAATHGQKSDSTSVAQLDKSSSEDKSANGVIDVVQDSSSQPHELIGHVRFNIRDDGDDVEMEADKHDSVVMDKVPDSDIGTDLLGDVKVKNGSHSTEDGDKDDDKDDDSDDDSDSDKDDDDYLMDSDDESSSDDSDSLRPGLSDIKEYWIRRSFHAGKTDMIQTYSGHRNARTMASIKEANFFGPNSEFVMSGSDDGRIFFWDKVTGKILNVVKGDRSVVNCLQPHPTSSFLLAASGIDHTIKIFMPTAEDRVDMSKIRGLKKPSVSLNELRPTTPMEMPRGPAEDELDPEHAYQERERSDGSDDDDDDDDDDILDDSDDDMLSRLSRRPHHLLIQIFRQLARERLLEGDNSDDHDEDHDHDHDHHSSNDEDDED